jgi:predicted glycosyltransferase
MTRKRILYISGSLGLGHVTRDLAIAKELHRQNPEIEISWLAGSPASDLIANANEMLHPKCSQYANLNIPAEKAAKGYALNLDDYDACGDREWEQNFLVFKSVIEEEKYDIIIGDETYEIWYRLQDQQHILNAPFVMIYDFVGLGYVKCIQRFFKKGKEFNQRQASDHKMLFKNKNLVLFIGEPEDILNERFGFLMPNKREYAQKHYRFVGYVLDFNPAEYSDQEQIKKKLGYGEEPLVVCTIGGTSIGKELLELCGQAYPIIREEISDLRMVLVCGPCLSTESLEVSQGVVVRGYIPALYEHFAASDLAIVQGGATSTLELTALRRPFLYFPLEEHFEQQVHVAGQLARHRAGVKMMFSQTTPMSLAEKVISNLGKKITYAPIPTDGAQKAAQLISQLL